VGPGSGPYTAATVPLVVEGQLQTGGQVGKGKVRLRFWVSMLILAAVLVLAGSGQWDMALAGLIGLVVANAGATAIHWD
jgi:hypothetical protein